MATTIRYKPSRKGSRQLLNSPEMLGGLQQVVSGIRDECYAGTGGTDALYVADVQPGRNRAHAMVKTGNGAAAAHNARTNALLKALGGGRA